MERGKIILIIILLLFLSKGIYSQGLFVEYDHPVYLFLERMEAAGFIENYPNETKPLLRSKITEYLSEIFDKRFLLNRTDRDLLNYFVDEFNFDITGKIDRYEILLQSKDYSITSNREKFIYAYIDRDNFSFFIKSHLSFSTLNQFNQKSAQLIDGGGRIYGSLKKFLGFEIDGKNGYVYGAKSTALKIQPLSYNFKLNEKPENRFFDRSYGYLSFEVPNFNLGIGKNRQTFGYGINKLILSDYSPEFDKIFMNVNFKSFTFDFIHGWLQNSKSSIDTSLLQKYFVYHRIAFSPIKNFRVGFGESVIYLRTSPELSYLNPFNFYKSVEHQLQDRDNALLFFDLEFLPIKNMRLYSTYLIDDIDFSKIGKHWHGNKTALNLGTKFSSEIYETPIDLQIEFTRIEPYTFSHRIDNLSYDNFDLPLTSDQPPNSYQFDFSINADFSPRFKIVSNFAYTKWGKNYSNDGGLVNVGGDIKLGKQESDSDTVFFLNGKIETIYKINLKMTYEIFRNIKIKANFYSTKFSSGSSSLILLIGLISFL